MRHLSMASIALTLTLGSLHVAHAGGEVRPANRPTPSMGQRSKAKIGILAKRAAIPVARVASFAAGSGLLALSLKQMAVGDSPSAAASAVAGGNLIITSFASRDGFGPRFVRSLAMSAGATALGAYSAHALGIYGATNGGAAFAMGAVGSFATFGATVGNLAVTQDGHVATKHE